MLKDCTSRFIGMSQAVARFSDLGWKGDAGAVTGSCMKLRHHLHRGKADIGRFTAQVACEIPRNLHTSVVFMAPTLGAISDDDTGA